MNTPRPISALSPEQLAEAATIQEKAARARAKVREAYENGRRAGYEQAEGMLRANAEALSTEHAKDADRIARLWRSNSDWKAKASLWLGSLIGVLFGVCVGWLSRDFGLDQAFTAASDATAKGAMIGTLERAAKGQP